MTSHCPACNMYPNNTTTFAHPITNNQAKGKTMTTRKKRQYTQAPITTDPGVPCVHCGHRYDHEVLKPYPNGNARMRCGGLAKSTGGCGKPFVVRRVAGGAMTSWIVAIAAAAAAYALGALTRIVILRALCR